MNTANTKTLREEFPDLLNGEFSDTRAFRLRDARVASVHGCFTDSKPWPGPQKNVMSWVRLENGLAVGWNENPTRGWSFPVVGA